MFTQKQTQQTTYWYDPSLLSEEVEQAFSIDYWQSINAITGSAQGRGTTWFVKGKQGEFALRHYRRGGLFGKLVEDSYWFSGLNNTRAYQELTLLKTLVEYGVNVPAPVAARVIKRGPTYKADILVQKLANARDLVAILSQGSLSKDQFFLIGQEIRKMHNINVNHTDLNIHNILIDDHNKVWIIDFDKCMQQADGQWKEGNLERLKRSFDKEVKLENIQLSSDAWQALLSGYHA